MFLESVDKQTRADFKARIKAVEGIMVKITNQRGLKEPKNVEVIFFHQDLESKVKAVNAVKEAWNGARESANARFLA